MEGERKALVAFACEEFTERSVNNTCILSQRDRVRNYRMYRKGRNSGSQDVVEVGSVKASMEVK